MKNKIRTGHCIVSCRGKAAFTAHAPKKRHGCLQESNALTVFISSFRTEQTISLIYYGILRRNFVIMTCPYLQKLFGGAGLAWTPGGFRIVQSTLGNGVCIEMDTAVGSSALHHCNTFMAVQKLLLFIVSRWKKGIFKNILDLSTNQSYWNWWNITAIKPALHFINKLKRLHHHIHTHSSISQIFIEHRVIIHSTAWIK